MASASVAVARTAVDSAVTVHPPASPFASLLRRSRFATFDPKIRQTYSTPPSHAARGSWGLKRPLALRRRNAFISLPAPFEDRAQFIEWDKAEDEVRFIRRFEEMQVRPKMTARTPWARTVGLKNLSNWLIDSEFAHRHEGPESEEPDALPLLEEAQKSQDARSAVQKSAPVDASLPNFGNAGPGNYGQRRALKKNASHKRVSPNVDAMLPHEFEAYLRRVRLLRPQFKVFLQSHAVEGRRTLKKLTEDLQAVERDPSKKIDASKLRALVENARKDSLHPSANLYQVVQTPNVSYHRRFIEAHTESQFADITNSSGVVIEQRPHPVGGLLYSHPSLLHSQIFSTPQPGIILQNAEDPTQQHHTMFIASFGGLSPVVAEQFRGDKTPLLNHNSSEGIKRENIKRSVAKMRLYPGSVWLEKPPRSVAEDSSLTSGLADVKISSQALVAGSQVMFSQSNPYKPGSMEYVGLQRVRGKGEASVSGSVSVPSSGMTPLMNPITRNTTRARPSVNVRTNPAESLLKWRTNDMGRGTQYSRQGAAARGKGPVVRGPDLFKTLRQLTAFGNDAEGDRNDGNGERK